MNDTPHIKKIQPYQRMASYYDRLMDYIDYDIWIEDIEELVEPLTSGANWLDISCGTGSMAIPLAKHGHKITAVDLSPDMIRIAQEKAAKAQITLAFEVGDMTSFGAKNNYDVVINLHDGLNYLLDSEAVQKFLKNTYRILKPGGILLFDVVTPLLCQNHFRGYREIFHDENGGYERFTTYDPTSRMAESIFTLNTSDEENVEVEAHIQKAYELEDIETFCLESHFKWWQILDDETLEKGDQNAERYLVMMRKPA